MPTPDRREIRRDILKLLKNNGRKEFRPKEISRTLNLRDNQAYRLFVEVLEEMEASGTIARVKGGRYTFRHRPMEAEGVLSVNPQGFGFVRTGEEGKDLYVRAGGMGTALDGDRVRVALLAPARGDRRQEAEVQEVLERGRKQTVGTFHSTGRFAFVRPDDNKLLSDIFVPSEEFNGAADGDKVQVSIDLWDNPKLLPEGRILQVIGRPDEPGVAVLALAMSQDVRVGFPPEVIEQAEGIPLEIPTGEIARRLDLREHRVYTIDPVDAKDFDDAIHVTELENGNFEVGVHIADVSHFVPEGTPLDQEALARATSVYLVGQVIPMLPEKLSNGVCSLRPREDKLAFSCIMEVTPRGKVVRYAIHESVIHSKERFTYEDAQEIIDGGNADHPLAADVLRAAELARTLTQKRMREGSVDFDTPEVRIVLDEQGRAVDVIRKDRKESNRLIEEFMLLANRSVAEHVGARRGGARPFIYRIHDRPNPEKMMNLAEYVHAFGYRLPAREGFITSKELNAFLKHVKGTPEEPVIEEAALRAMAKAKYSTGNIGHYGLGFKHYSHFTSPIRRYPDLIAHRLLKRYAGGASGASAQRLEEQCVHCSERERAAEEAERESVKLKKVEYIQQHIGETFAGVVSGVAKFGVFIELEKTLVEGLVHVREMYDDYYEYDEKSYSLVGSDSRRTIRVGDLVNVVVKAANLETRQIDFAFAE